MTTTNGQDGIVAHPHTTVLRAPTGHFTLSSIHNRSDMAARVNTHVEQTLLSVQRHTSGNTCAGSPKDSPVRPPATLLSQHRQECLCYISASLARFKKRRSHSHALLRRRSASYTGTDVPTRPPQPLRRRSSPREPAPAAIGLRKPLWRRASARSFRAETDLCPDLRLDPCLPYPRPNLRPDPCLPIGGGQDQRVGRRRSRLGSRQR